jgi:hypothetical protein
MAKNKKKPDSYKIYCIYCKHVWIIISEKDIPADICKAWASEAIKEHESMCPHKKGKK